MAQDFMETLVAYYNGGALSLMISIGHRTRLFDQMAGAGPISSQVLASRAGLNERYVREWLGAMTTGQVVIYDPERKTYELPEDRAALLTRKATPNNLAVAAQFIAVLGAVEDQIVKCFEKGGGVPYSAYPRFHEVMAEESYQTIVHGLDEHVLPLAEGIRSRLAEGIEVADIGCGSGMALTRMAELYPRSRFTGYDFSEEAIGKARAMAEARKLPNAKFEVKDVSRLEAVAKFDLVTAFDAIHDQVAPQAVLDGIRRALRPGGTYLMQDIKGHTGVENNLGNPLAPYLYTVSCMHCMTVSLSAGGDGLGTMWGKEKALAMLKEAGFGSVEVKELPHDIMNFYYVAKP